MKSEMVELHPTGRHGASVSGSTRASARGRHTGYTTHHDRGCRAMTAVADAPQADVEGISQPRAVVVGIMAGEGVQIGVLLDANAPVSVMTDPLLKVVNSRLRELGETHAGGHGPRPMGAVPGRRHAAARHPVADRAGRLRRRPACGSGSSRTPNTARKSSSTSPPRFRRTSASGSPRSTRSSRCRSAPRWSRSGVTVGVGAAGLVALAPQLVAAHHLRRRSSPRWCWRVLDAADAGQTQQERRVADIMLLSGLGAAGHRLRAAAPPGGVGSPQAVLGFGVLAVAAVLALRFTGRRLAMYTAIVTVSAVTTIAALARMVAMTSAVTLFTCVVLVCVFAYQGAPSHLAPAGRHPAARVPVGHQPVGLRGSTRSAHHRGALRRRSAGPGGPRFGSRRAAAGRARALVPDAVCCSGWAC